MVPRTAALEVVVGKRRMLVALVMLGVGGLTLSCQTAGRWLRLGGGPTPTPTVSPLADVPTPSLYATTWEDRTVYREGLTDAAQDALERLPGAPIYHLELRLSDDLTSITGRQEVLFTNTEDVPLDQVVFRLYPNLLGGRIEITDVAVNGGPVNPILAGMDSVMTVLLDEPLAVGESAVVSMVYEIQIPTETSGNYGIFGLSDGVLAIPHVYPMLAVYDETGWNTEIPPEYGDVVYADSGFYRVRLEAPIDLSLVTSGVDLSRSEATGRQVLEVAAGPMRDFSLAASRDFVSIERHAGDTLIRSTALTGLDAGAEDILDYAQRSLDVFGGRFGAYPFSELDLVSTPTSALGVEYPGIIAMAARMYPPDSPDYPRQLLESVAAHEVGHQWFYSLVGNDQIDQPWLDESLTQYVTMLYFGDVYGPQGAAGFRQSLEARWAHVGSLPIPIGMPVGAYTPAEYSSIVYGRGALFFDALADEMGQAALDNGLRAYVEQNQYGVATPAALKTALESRCSCELDALFEEWVVGGS